MEHIIKIEIRPIGAEMIPTVDARELWEKLGVATQFRVWITRRIDESRLVEGKDFTVLTRLGENPNGGRPLKEYFLSLDAATKIVRWQGVNCVVKLPNLELSGIAPRAPRVSHESYVYFIRCAKYVKIGRTTNLVKRLKAIQSCNPFPLKVLLLLLGGREAESKLHQAFDKYHLRGEWFSLSHEILNYVKKWELTEEGKRYAVYWRYREKAFRWHADSTDQVGQSGGGGA